MITTVKGKVIDVFQQEWEMEGKKGVTNRLCVYCGNGKFENVAIKAEEIKNYIDQVNNDIEVECNLYIKKNGSYNLKANN